MGRTRGIGFDGALACGVAVGGGDRSDGSLRRGAAGAGVGRGGTQGGHGFGALTWIRAWGALACGHSGRSRGKQGVADEQKADG